MEPVGGLDAALRFGFSGRIAVEDLQQFARFTQRPATPSRETARLAQLRKLLHGALRRFRIAPEVVRARAFVELGYAPTRGGVVKDAP